MSFLHSCYNVHTGVRVAVRDRASGPGKPRVSASLALTDDENKGSLRLFNFNRMNERPLWVRLHRPLPILLHAKQDGGQGCTSFYGRRTGQVVPYLPLHPETGAKISRHPVRCLHSRL